ncbi:hypothetical protein [Candidatus Ruthia endofausta]|nr:hypothetical protein [Candidatus Ruthia endofausta]
MILISAMDKDNKTSGEEMLDKILPILLTEDVGAWQKPLNLQLK